MIYQITLYYFSDREANHLKKSRTIFWTIFEQLNLIVKFFECFISLSHQKNSLPLFTSFLGIMKYMATNSTIQLLTLIYMVISLQYVFVLEKEMYFITTFLKTLIPQLNHVQSCPG